MSGRQPRCRRGPFVASELLLRAVCRDWGSQLVSSLTLRIACTLVLVLVPVGALAQTPAGPVAAYSFDEGTGTLVGDASGNGHNGAAANASWTAGGKFGGAMVFNGSNTLVTIPDAAALRLTTGMTLEAWVKPSVVTAEWRDVIYKGDDNYYLEATTSSAARPGAGVIVGSAHVETFASAALTVNTWAHLAATYDGTVLRLYVNGVQVSTRNRTGTRSEEHTSELQSL